MDGNAHSIRFRVTSMQLDTTSEFDAIRAALGRRYRRVAFIYHWLVAMRGGERVLEQMLRLFPHADVYAHVYRQDKVSKLIASHNPRTTFINRLPFADRHYQKFLPLMPAALESLDLRGYDLVVSTEVGPAKGVIPAPDALHVCYVNSPMRYLWDHYQDYRDSSGMLSRAMMSLTFPALRRWDVTSAARVDRFMSNSSFIQQRVEKYWRRNSTVVHPPVPVDAFGLSKEVTPRYMWASQMIRYKRPDLAVDAFNELGLPLLMVGDGALFDAMKRRASNNIELVRRLPFDELKRAYATCKALIFTAEEDFGIVPVEANASGRPVLAYGRGGARDTVKDGVSGLFFSEQTIPSLVEAIPRLERWLPDFDPHAAMMQADAFRPEVFDRKFSEVILA